ncbi:glycosyltransferase [Candidatus Jidaibacter acanthamoebae]|nr:glycosyltransferase [Candidatus Jidaibacter acanthamoeba]
MNKNIDIKKVLFVVDVRGWAFDQVAQYVTKILHSKYQCEIVYTEDFTPKSFLKWLARQSGYAVVHFFYRGYLLRLINVIANESKGSEEYINFLCNIAVTTHVPDHLFISEKLEIIQYNPLFKFIDNYFVTSHKLKNLYKNILQYPFPEQVIFDNIKIPEFSTNKEQRDQPSDILHILWAGNSAWKIDSEKDYKGLNSIILPAIQILEQRKIPIKISIFDKAKSPASKEEILTTLSNADIVLIASIAEGTPLPLIEAMAAGCAVISTDVGIVREVLPEIQQQFIVARTPADFVQAIEYLHHNRDILNQICRQNIQSYKKYFNNPSIYGNYWDEFLIKAITNSTSPESYQRKVDVIKSSTILDKKGLTHKAVDSIYTKLLSNKQIKACATKALYNPYTGKLAHRILNEVQNFRLKNNYNSYIAQIFEDLNNNALKQEVSLCAIFSPYSPGVKHSTLGLFENALPFPFAEHENPEVPQPKKLVDQVARTILDSNIANIIISGGTNSHLQLVKRLRELSFNKPKIFFLWHGSPAQWVEQKHYKHFQAWFELYQSGKIQGFITLKKGLEKVLECLGIKSYLLQNMIPNPENIVNKAWNHSVPPFIIGLWSASFQWGKNIYPQLLATRLVQESLLLTNADLSNIQWMADDKKTKFYPGKMSREDLFNNMAGTHVTLYATHTECSSMIALESISVGTPCIVGSTSGLYDDAPILYKGLTVNRVDCPLTIAKAIYSLRNNPKPILERLPQFRIEYNNKAEELKERFLSNIL